ncbi:MAG: DsbA family protein [Hyphomicrobiaceae bacterium]
METPPPTRLVYFADPMCSWCYGFSPVISALAERFEARVPLDLVMGGLRAGNTEPMRQQDKDYIRSAWTRVGAATGQPFDMGFFTREGFVYDTEPACRAVVTARRLVPRMALPLMARIQQAFYAENRDMTAPEAIADVAEEAGFDRAGFAQAFASPEARNETFRDFLTAQSLGIRGFPTLIAGSEERGYALVTNGYRPLEDLAEPLERWVAAGAPVAKAG